MKRWVTTLAILAVLSVAFSSAEDFKTINGKLYKDATVSRVEADGIVLKNKTGISKVYFIELPEDVQKRFRPSPAKTVAPQHQREAIKVEAKKGESQKAKDGRRVGGVAVSATFMKFLIIGALVITSVVLAILRRRLG